MVTLQGPARLVLVVVRAACQGRVVIPCSRRGQAPLDFACPLVQGQTRDRLNKISSGCASWSCEQRHRRRNPSCRSPAWTGRVIAVRWARDRSIGSLRRLSAELGTGWAAGMCCDLSSDGRHPANESAVAVGSHHCGRRSPPGRSGNPACRRRPVVRRHGGSTTGHRVAAASRSRCTGGCVPSSALCVAHRPTCGSNAYRLTISAQPQPSKVACAELAGML